MNIYHIYDIYEYEITISSLNVKRRLKRHNSTSIPVNNPDLAKNALLSDVVFSIVPVIAKRWRNDLSIQFA